MKKLAITIFCILVLGTVCANAQLQSTPVPQLVHGNGHYSLIVDGAPYLIQEGLNTIEVSVNLSDLRGTYDFAYVQKFMDVARENDLRLILLLSPQYVRPMKKEAKAYTVLMRYLKENDNCHTVIMVQVDSGSAVEAPDYGKAAAKLFGQEVPYALMKPSVLKALGVDTEIQAGSWLEVFGEKAEEYFRTWYEASYINYVAEAGRKINRLPVYVIADAAVKAGADDYVAPIYKAVAPAVDLRTPDIY